MIEVFYLEWFAKEGTHFPLNLTVDTSWKATRSFLNTIYLLKIKCLGLEILSASEASLTRLSQRQNVT